MQSVREHRRLTQLQLGAIVGVSAAQISSIEGGSRRPSLPVAMRLVEALALPCSDALALLRQLAGLPAQPAPPALDALPLTLDGQAVEVLELTQDGGGVWWALVRPSSSPHATARRIPIAGLTLLPTPAVRAA